MESWQESGFSSTPGWALFPSLPQDSRLGRASGTKSQCVVNMTRVIHLPISDCRASVALPAQTGVTACDRRVLWSGNLGQALEKDRIL